MEIREKDNSWIEGKKEVRKHTVKAIAVYHTPFHLQSVLGNLVSQMCDIFVSLLTQLLNSQKYSEREKDRRRSPLYRLMPCSTGGNDIACPAVGSQEGSRYEYHSYIKTQVHGLCSLSHYRKKDNTSVSMSLITSHLSTLKYIKNFLKWTLESSLSDIQSQQSLYLSQRCNLIAKERKSST